MKKSLPLFALACCSAIAIAYDYNGTPASYWIVGHTTSQIKQAIVDGWRPTSIEVETVVGSYSVFRVAYVRNTGTHYKEVRFEGEQSSSQINTVRNAGWRIEDVAVEATTAGTKLAGIFIKNTVDPRTTLYFWGGSSSSISTWLAANPSYRLLDLDRYPSGSSTVYAGVYVKNTGSAYVSGWGWSPSMSWSSLGTWANTNAMRVIDLDRHENGNYAVVFAKRSAGQRVFTFGNRTLGELDEFIGGYGVRVQTISETSVNGVKRYSGTAVNNVNSQSARLADLVGPTHNGVQGFYVKEIGGSTIVDLNASRSMHPSSTIKILLHFTGVYNTATNSLNTRKLNNILMPTVHSRMMWNSDNDMANLCLDTYGEVYSETVGRSICGMSTVTDFRNRFGTGGPYGNTSITTTTLVDLGKIYEKVEGGYFNATKDAWFRTNMLNQTNSGWFNAVITSVKGQIGISNTNYNSWLAKVKYLSKAGSNSDSNNITGYWSIAGTISLPFKSGLTYTTHKYLFGHYVNKSTINYTGSSVGEVVREQIKASMLTFK